MPDSWACIMHRNGPGLIDDEVRHALKMAACMLSQAKTTEMLFEWRECQGVIKTDWQFYRVQGMAGYLFKAEAALPNAPDYQVNFLLSETDLLEGVKLLEAGKPVPDFAGTIGVPESKHTRLPIEEFYRFENLRVASRYYN